MIFVDAGYQDILHIPPSARQVSGLFEATGVQFVVSNKAFPPSGKLIEKHVENNSAFIFVSKYPCKLGVANFIKLAELGAKVKYHIILGSILLGTGDSLVYNGDKLYDSSYRYYVEGIANESSLGVTCANIEIDYLSTYLVRIEQLVGTSSEFLPSVIRKLSQVRDGRATLASIPIIGDKANFIWDKYKKAGIDSPLLIDILATLTNYSKNNTQLAKSICSGVRSWLGIPDGWNICLEPDTETENKEGKDG